MIARHIPLRALSFVFAFALFILLFGGATALLAQDDGSTPDSDAVLPAEADATPGLVPFTNIDKLESGGEGGCLITKARALFCWGYGFSGQNGVNNTDNLSTPTAVTLSNVTQVSRGGSHTCAVTTSGKAYCWGSNNSGQLGVDYPNNKLVPTEVIPSGAAQIAAGATFTCALMASGQVWCWGDNTYGQSGTGAAGGIFSTPQAVPGITTATAIDAGTFHTCALLAAGSVQCWGNSSSGQVGNNTTDLAVVLPTLAALPEPVVQITTGGSTNCALTAAGRVYCWGENGSGQAGTFDAPSDKLVPVSPQSLETAIVAVDSNSSHTCALTVAWLVYCWGNNIGGQLGGGAGDGGAAKVSVMGLPAEARAIAVGTFSTCAVLLDNRAVCWGSNQNNALGDGTNLSSFAPTYVRTTRTCFHLTLKRTGDGGQPFVDPLNSIGCPLNHYTAGTTLQLGALPANLNRVQSWSAPVAFQAGNTSALLSMPNVDTTATVTYAPCRILTRTHTGNGGNPTPSFNNSAGCPAGRYAPGEVIQLAATPSTNQRIQAWSGTAIAPELGLPVNSVVMPDADRTVNVAYQPCNLLTIAAEGEGELPGVFPAASEGCPAGAFVAGEAIQFTAAPAQGWQVARWTGTANDASTATNNTLVMPASNRAVSVVYEELPPPVVEDPRIMLPIVLQ